ncbi:MAG: DUF3108 domain-containing protein [Thermonemataceae bacterium]|nr:DUF3108 domain-containing protein [Thermonemataceae bacterium]
MKYSILFLFLLFFSLTSKTKAQISPAGERFTYSFLKDGNEVAELNIKTEKNTEKIANQVCYRITAVGKITAALGIVNFDNKVTSWIETKKLKPLKLHAYFDDGKKKTNYITEYNLNTAKATSYTLEQPNDKRTSVFSQDTEDLFSAFYKIRKIDFKSLKTNDIIKIKLLTEPEKIEEVQLKYLGKKKMSIYNGEKDCYILILIAPKVDGLEDKSLRIAITADAQQIPAKLYARTRKGFIVGELKSYTK